MVRRFFLCRAMRDLQHMFADEFLRKLLYVYSEVNRFLQLHDYKTVCISSIVPQYKNNFSFLHDEVAVKVVGSLRQSSPSASPVLGVRPYVDLVGPCHLVLHVQVVVCLGDFLHVC